MMIQGRVTEAKVRQWVETNRPELEIKDEGGIKGFFRRDVGPAHGFQSCGPRWADVAATLGAIEISERV
jgi:hypothetical protein